MKEQATHAELSHKYEVSVSQISQWKHEAISNMDKIFGGRAERESFDKDLQIQRLQSKVSELVLERDFFRGGLQESQSQIKLKPPVVEGHKNLSIRRQCEILQISRNQYYYKPKQERRTTFGSRDSGAQSSESTST